MLLLVGCLLFVRIRLCFTRWFSLVRSFVVGWLVGWLVGCICLLPGVARRKVGRGGVAFYSSELVATMPIRGPCGGFRCSTVGAERRGLLLKRGPAVRTKPPRLPASQRACSHHRTRHGIGNQNNHDQAGLSRYLLATG